jgi:hypothetical protein
MMQNKLKEPSGISHVGINFSILNITTKWASRLKLDAGFDTIAEGHPRKRGSSSGVTQPPPYPHSPHTQNRRQKSEVDYTVAVWSFQQISWSCCLWEFWLAKYYCQVALIKGRSILQIDPDRERSGIGQLKHLQNVVWSDLVLRPEHNYLRQELVPSWFNLGCTEKSYTSLTEFLWLCNKT